LEKPKQRVAVIMQRRAIDNPWQSHVWEAGGVLAGYEGEAAPRVIVEDARTTQWLYPGFHLVLQRAEAQGYFHNISAAAPSVFVLWRMETGCAVPHYVTASYDEASRWMDGGAQVDGVPMPQAMQAWVRQFVEENYRPEPGKRLRPRSFLAPQDRG
jgi:hypothetical protein